jgi:hypothetical protein
MILREIFCAHRSVAVLSLEHDASIREDVVPICLIAVEVALVAETSTLLV